MTVSMPECLLIVRSRDWDSFAMMISGVEGSCLATGVEDGDADEGGRQERSARYLIAEPSIL